LQGQFLIAIEVDVKDEERNHDREYAIVNDSNLCFGIASPHCGQSGQLRFPY
jgi:hypothetical protein